MEGMFSNDEVKAAIDPHTMGQIRNLSIQLYKEMKTVPDKKGNVRELDKAEDKKIEQMGVL